MAITTICYAYQAIYLFIPMFVKRKKPEQAEKQHRFAILIAARNEEAVLPHLLKTIRDQNYPAELITTYVIADNCTDETARVARNFGARVYKRFNLEKIGKGYALEELLQHFVKLCNLDTNTVKRGRGHHKSPELRLYDNLLEYINRLKKYSEHIYICGDNRNSYSKTDHDATFMRMKKDYMGNDQLLPAYNVQFGVCDEYIAVYDVKQFASDMDCFVPLMEKFNNIYGKYPKYPVADAGYGSFNNYLYCEEHEMEKYMKFTMYEKASNDKKYIEDPYKAVNFPIDDEGCPVCPNNKKFHYLYSRPIKDNKYGRTEEFYQCEDCTACPHKEKCCKCKGNRIIRLNEELSQFHQEVLGNLNCIHGALLSMNRSIQSEGANGIIKWNRSYTRVRRRGLKALNLEIGLICCGFNLHKFHLKKKFLALAA
jgi:glycosyltransferase involved in cell wall biosynthesis